VGVGRGGGDVEGNWGQIPIILNFKLFLDGLKMPCFEGVVSMGGACSRFYDTCTQRFAENLYHDRSKNRGQIPIILKNAWVIFGQASVYVHKTQAMECFPTYRFHRSLFKLVS